MALMTSLERIIIAMIIYGKLTDQRVLYQITTDLGIESFGQVRVNIPRTLATQQLYQEYCLGCHTHTGNMGLEAVPECIHCKPGDRDQGLATIYWLHFLFGVESEGIQRRALHQELYQTGILR